MWLLFYIIGALVWPKSLQRALKPYPTLLAVQNHQWLDSASVPRAGYHSVCSQNHSAAGWHAAHSIQERGGALPELHWDVKLGSVGHWGCSPAGARVAEGTGASALCGRCERGCGRASPEVAGQPHSRCPEQHRTCPRASSYPHPTHTPTYFMNQVCGQCFEQFIRCSFMGLFSLRFAM